jgi:hypothetical protein
VSFLTVYTCELSRISQLGAVRALHGRALQSKAEWRSRQGVGERQVQLNACSRRGQDWGDGLGSWVLCGRPASCWRGRPGPVQPDDVDSGAGHIAHDCLQHAAVAGKGHVQMNSVTGECSPQPSAHLAERIGDAQRDLTSGFGLWPPRASGSASGTLELAEQTAKPRHSEPAQVSSPPIPRTPANQ